MNKEKWEEMLQREKDQYVREWCVACQEKRKKSNLARREKRSQCNADEENAKSNAEVKA